MGTEIGRTMHIQNEQYPCTPMLVTVDNAPVYDSYSGLAFTVDSNGNVVITPKADMMRDADTYAVGTFHDPSICPDGYVPPNE